MINLAKLPCISLAHKMRRTTRSAICQTINISVLVRAPGFLDGVLWAKKLSIASNSPSPLDLYQGKSGETPLGDELWRNAIVKTMFFLFRGIVWRITLEIYGLWDGRFIWNVWLEWCANKINEETLLRNL